MKAELKGLEGRSAAEATEVGGIGSATTNQGRAREKGGPVELKGQCPQVEPL